MLFYVARTFHLHIHIMSFYPHPSTDLTYCRFALRRWQPEVTGYSYCLCYHAVHDTQHLYLLKRSNLYIPNWETKLLKSVYKTTSLYIIQVIFKLLHLVVVFTHDKFCWSIEIRKHTRKSFFFWQCLDEKLIWSMDDFINI